MNRAILFLFAAACNTDAETDSSSTADTGTVPTDLPTYTPDWEGVQQLFAENCDRCHPAMGESYIDLHVEIPNDIGYYQYLVKPGNPEGSVLWQVVSEPQAGQIGMPRDTFPLPLAVVDPIRVWIEDGALLE